MLLHNSSFQLGMFRFHHGGRLPSGCFRFDLCSENSFVPLHSCCLTFGPRNSKCVTMDLWSLPRSIMSSASESLQSFMLLLSMRMWYNCLSFARGVRYAACFSSLFLYIVLSAEKFWISSPCFSQSPRLFDLFSVYVPFQCQVLVQR